MTDSAETMRALVRWLKDAPTSVYTFTTDGQATVCHPRYLLASDRDVIIALLEREIAALSASGTKSDGGGEVADPQKPEIGSVEFRGKKSLGALPGSCAPTADATALPSSDGVAPIPSDLKRGEIFSFDDGLLMIKMSGYGQEDGWGTLAFHERQIEIDADGFHCVEIAPSELREIRDFLNRVTKPGPSDPIPSQPDERERVKQVIELAMIEEAEIQYADFTDRDRQREKIIANAADAILAMQAERRGAKQDIVDLAKDLVALWTSPKISGLPRSERNAAIEDTRNAMIEAVGNLARSSVGSEQGSSNSEVTGSSPVAPATNAAVAQSAEQPFCKGTVSGSSPDGGTNTQPAPIAGLEPVAWRFTKLSVWHVTSERNWAEAHGDCVEPLYTRAQLEAHAAEQVRAERRGDNTIQRDKIYRAAERSNTRFGQWIPERWVNIFVEEMSK